MSFQLLDTDLFSILNVYLAVVDLAFLEELDLSSNQITIVPPRIGQMKTLTR